jgi:RNA polymerase sigma-70 factor (ECF subfamily)
MMRAAALDAALTGGKRMAIGVSRELGEAGGAPLATAPADAATDCLVARLRSGDEDAFRELVSLYHGNMLGLARTYVRTKQSAEEIVQDTWIAVIEGIDRFEGRSSLKSWLYAILVNKARTRAVREGRTVSFSELSSDDPDDAAMDAERFRADGHWANPPAVWEELTPERFAAGRELLGHMRDALDRLPEAQRAVIILRDVEGCEAEEACNILGLSETNQRVLLHRGRAKLRDAMERLLAVPRGPGN